MFRIFCVSALLAVLAVAAHAENRPIKDFYGQYVGSGAIFAEDTGGRPVSRDSFVEITPLENGFKLFWNTQSARPAKEGVARFKVKGATRFFKLENGSRYAAEDSGDPFKGKRKSWAYIDGDSLFVTELQVKESGSYDLTSYERRLLPGDKMKVTFTRIQNGEVVRRAMLTLDKLKPAPQ